MSGLVRTPETVNAPGRANCTVTLSAAAAAGGVPVAVSSNDVKATLLPASATVAASATTAAFTVNGSAVTNPANGPASTGLSTANSSNPFWYQYQYWGLNKQFAQ